MNDRLITRLRQQAPFEHRVDSIELIETHISWVLLTGDYAYKFRKPVNFGFLDFTTLAQRRLDCINELRLNRRLAAPLYCDLIRVDAAPDGQLRLSRSRPDEPPQSDTLDYAVRMRQFAQTQLLSERQRRGLLDAALIDQLGARLARFHQRLPAAAPTGERGDFATLSRVIGDNFSQLRRSLEGRPLPPQLAAVEAWSQAELARQRDLLTQRREQGMVREGHGDLHLGNIVLWQEQALPFDCIEFNPRYRWVDTLNDLAFLLMDLEYRAEPALAQRLLNRYLELSGDYGGVALLPLFKSYRALVRAKVALLGDPDQGLPDALAHLELAHRYRAAPRPRLVLMHGVSGSGKSWHSERLAQRAGLIRLRSDRERPRLFPHPAERYSAQADRATYAQLLTLTQRLLEGGNGVVVDAAFLYRWQRQPFIELAQRQGIGLEIAVCHAARAELERRLMRRAKTSADPSEADAAVLQRQLLRYQPLSAAELRWAVAADPAQGVSPASS